jgi:hypothetical protein
LSLPLPLRKNGVINATDAELDGAQRFCEQVAIASTVLVFVGLVFEVLIAIKHPSFDSCLERWGSVIADALVAVGVLGELLPSMLVRGYNTEVKRRSDDKLSEANRRAGEASERAADAELATEKLKEATSWRTLTNMETEAISQALKASSPAASVRFTLLANDPESLYFAGQIATAFENAEWNVGYRFESYSHEILSGILLPEPSVSWLDEIRVVNRRVREAFIAAELRFATGWPDVSSAYMTGGGEPLRTPFASVYVGPKPMPVLE